MYSSQNSSQNIFTVTKLNRLARSVLESEIGQIWLSAEISNFVAASSGHWYFTLKDERAQVRGAMFRGANRRVVSRPKEGDKVLVRANIGLYEARGDYQLVVEHLEPEGEGLLKQQFEQLKVTLAAEGMFAQQYKQPLPDTISKVGIVTSATGAALHDILTVLKRRNPAISVVIYPTQVQGDSASAQIVKAISDANTRNEVDILIVGRGGGSLEDLWCFNQESVARAIFTSSLPVVSAVGHEVDVTIADFVADVRAPTPSAAAELVSADSSEFLNHIQRLIARLGQSTQNIFKEKFYQRQVLDKQLQQYHPKAILQQQSQYLDQLSTALNSSMRDRLYREREYQVKLHHKIHQSSPQESLVREHHKVEELTTRLRQQMQTQLNQNQHRLGSVSQLLDTVSPLATLARGYNIAFKNDKLIKSAKELAPGDTLVSKFSDGEVISEVKST